MKKRRMLILKLPLVGLLMFSGPFAIGPDLNAALASQSIAEPALRVGARAQELSKEEIIALEMLLPGTRVPWLLMDDFDAAMMPTMVAYLPPEFQTPELRRGTTITLGRLADAPSDSKRWAVIEANGAYAQVAVSGRSFDPILRYEDVNRPFRVIGTFDDAEILSVVNFFRTKFSRFPLRAIERDGFGHVLLSFATEPLELVLENQKQGWVILARETIRPPNNREPRSPLDRFVPTQTILNHVENVPQ